jgi:hypothetical protein
LTEQVDRGNFKNQVMTIKDFGGIDSKRTSQQSETSNEKEFLRMLSNQTQKNNPNVNSSDGYKNHDISSPTAEHLEEPSIIGRRESLQASNSGELS